MEKVLNMTYTSSLTNLLEVNSSFDSGILQIAYPGLNRNNSFISKEDFVRNIKSIYNCPIVCNYDRDSDTLGGHDMDVIRDKDGQLKLINLTTPVGCIPESAKTWFADVEDEDGVKREYLFAEALLWKRQEAYRKIKDDGVIAQSMEITVKSGEMIDGVFHIKDFEFTAFALIGVEPCYEGASLEVFSKQDFKQQLSEMMQDLKESFSLIGTSNEEFNIHPQTNPTEGGNNALDSKNEIIAKYGIDVESLDFSIEDLTEEELIAKFEEMKAAADDGADSGADNQDDADNKDDNSEGEGSEDGDSNDNKFALNSNIVEEICNALDAVTVEREWGTCNRYWFVDYDPELSIIYCWDTNDWLLYGFSYSMNGDNVVIDFESKKRKKYDIVDFDEGDQASPFAEVFAQLENAIHEDKELEAKYDKAVSDIEAMNAELDELRSFKSEVENAAAKSAREDVLAKFEDLSGNEDFEALCDNCMNYSLEDLEEKCYAIRGRVGTPAKFSLDGDKAPKLKIDKTNDDDTSNEPYGGLFSEYDVG